MTEENTQENVPLTEVTKKTKEQMGSLLGKAVDVAGAVVGPKETAPVEGSMYGQTSSLVSRIDPTNVLRDFKNKALRPPAPAPGVLAEESKVKETFEPFKIPFTNIGFLGIETQQTRERDIVDSTNMQPIVKIQEVIDFTKPNVQKNFMRATKFLNKQGEVLPLSGMSLEERIDAANKFGAVTVVHSVKTTGDKSIETKSSIPYYKGLGEALAFPENFKENVVNFATPFPPTKLQKELGYDTFNIILRNSDSKITKPLLAYGLNEKLKKFGLDERERLGVIKYHFELPLYGDLGKAYSGIKENVFRTFIAMPLWAGGEFLDFMDMDFSDANEGDIRDSVWRTKLLDKIIPRHAVMLQDSLAGRGIKIDLPTAEHLSRTFHGEGTYFATLAAEIAGPTKGIGAYQSIKAMGEVDQFNAWRAAKLKSHPLKKKKMTEQEKANLDTLLIEGYIAQRLRDETGVVSYIANKGVPIINLTEDIPILSTLLDKGISKPIQNLAVRFNRVIVSNQLYRGFQIEDAALAIDKRAEVVQSVNYAKNIKDRITGLKRNLDGRPPTDKELKKIENLEETLLKVQTGHQAIVAQSGLSKFMRDATVQDNFMIVGAAAGGYVAAGMESDPFLGEGLGLMIGLVSSIVQGKRSDALDYVIANFGYSGGKLSQFVRTGAKSKHASFLATYINRFTPEIQQGIAARANYFERMQTELINEGVNPEIVERGIDKVLGLGILQLIEEQSRMIVSTSQIKAGDIQEIEKIRSFQIEFVNELRGVLKRLDDAPNSGKVGTSTDKLQKLVLNNIRLAEETIENSQLDLNNIVSFNRSRILDVVEGNDANSYLTKKVAESVDDSLQNLVDLGIISASKPAREMTVNEIRDLIGSLDSRINDSIVRRSNDALLDLSTTQQARHSVTEVSEGVKAYGARQGQAPIVPQNDNFASLFATLFESSHTMDRNNAGAGFRVLDKAAFKNAAGEFVGGRPTADGGIILDKLISSLELGSESAGIVVDMMKDMRMSKITPAHRNKFMSMFNDVTNSFFESIAASDPEKYENGMASVLTMFEEGLLQKGVRLKKGKNAPPRKVQIVYELRKLARQNGADPDDVLGPNGTSPLQLTFKELSEIDTTISKLKFKATNPEIKADYENIGNTVKQMLSGRFQTTEGNVIEVFGVTGTDGQRYSISDLYLDVPDPNGITKQVRAGEVREQANNDWSEYKAIWFDNAQNKSWMGWGKRVARNVTGDHPLGLERPLKETKWFDFNKISNAEFNGEDFFTPIREALGTKLPQLQDTKQIIEGSSKAKALTKTLEVGVGEWLVQQIQKPDFDVNEVRRQLNKISNTFYSVDSQGTKKALLDVDQLEKNLFAYGEGTVPDAIRKKNDAAVEALIQKNTNDIKSDVTKMQSGLRRAVNILSRLSPESKTGLDAADFLINGGPNVIDQVKQSLRKIPGKEKLSEEEIDEVIRLLYIDSVDNRIFVKTGTSEVSSMNPNGFTEVYDVDLSMLRDLVGFNNPEKAAVVKKVIGERRFNVYNRMIEFIENEQNQINQGLQLSGVPRRFSPEAWISRFYAMKRHVISPPYVGTEALLQTMRLNNFSMLKSILTDPDVGELFLEMVRTGKPLDKTRELQFAQALAATFVKGQAYLGKSEQDEVVDEYGRKFTISAGGFTTNSETLNFMRDDAKEYSRRASVRGPKNLEDQNQFLQLFNK